MLKLLSADYNNAQHAAAILELLSLYARDPMGGGQDLSDFVREHLIEQLAARPDALTVLAFQDDQPVGLINCFESFSTFQCKPLMNIHDVVVHPNYRGRGISTRLLNRVEELAKQRGCCKLTLEVLQGNDIARAAYRKVGFKPYQLDPDMGQALFWEKTI